MSANFTYKNTRDFQFLLKEWLPFAEILKYPQFRENYSIDDAESILNTFMKMCKEVIEPTCDDGELNPVRFENGRVIPPPTIGPTLEKLQKDGWGASNVDKTPGAMVLTNFLHPFNLLKNSACGRRVREIIFRTKVKAPLQLIKKTKHR